MYVRFPVSIDDFYRVVFEGEEITIPESLLSSVKKSFNELKAYIASGKTGYGINTGFGKLATTRIDINKLEEIQENIVLSHAAGVGQAMDEQIVKGAMFIRLVSLLRGHSGVKPETVKLLCEMVNRGIIPIVPEKGSVGASGDLAPSAHMALVMIGRGKAFFKNRIYSGKKALEKAGLKPIKLSPKEGLALLNGTHFMTSYTAYGLWHSRNLLRCANMAAATSIEGISGRLEPFSEKLNRLRPHRGQIKVASEIRKMLRGTPRKRTKRVQDPYSFRCVPQVHGAVLDTIGFVESKVETELNSVTDNPLIIDGKVYSGGNFHGEPIAFSLDFLAIALTELSSISERRLAQLMDSSFTGLPPFLVNNPGVNSGFMIPQVTAAALVSENKILSHPASVDSIPTSANQEDHVSMGLNGGIKLKKIIENTYYVLAIEVMAAVQAIDLKRGGVSPAIEKVVKKVRRIVKYYDRDREHSNDIESLADMMRRGEI